MVSWYFLHNLFPVFFTLLDNLKTNYTKYYILKISLKLVNLNTGTIYMVPISLDTGYPYLSMTKWSQYGFQSSYGPTNLQYCTYT
jgi:hypothetical protein